MVTGKGGVGKTTIAAGLAVAAARRDGSATFVEFGDSLSGKRILKKTVSKKAGGVEHRVVRSNKAIHEMSAEVLGSSILARVVTGNFAMKRLFRAGPALRELAQLFSILRLADERPGRRVIVDMPATGHGVAWLRVPGQLRDLLRAGPLAGLARRVADELVNPSRCSVAIVSLPERLVLKETLELCEAMQKQVGLPPARLFINRVPPPLPPHALREARRLASGGGDLGVAAAALVEVVASRDQARGEALEALRQAVTGLAIHPVMLPAEAHDPTAGHVADLLEAEGAT